MNTEQAILDGNEAASRIAYSMSEVCAIYPITPASVMGEWVDQWAAEKRPNIMGDVPRVIEMQSEGGAAGAVHGALLAGALSSTFTASQGLLLMIPVMYKIAGELTPTVFHIAARSLATHALSIFGDHSDVMAARSTGFAMLFAGNVQEAHDMALIAHATSLLSRIPFLHIFDGFRTSHEINRIEVLPDEIIRTMMDEEALRAFRQRSLSPDNPFIRGTAMNADVFFQCREAANPFYEAVPRRTEEAMERLAKCTGRSYRLFDYYGHPEAERIIILIGSAAGTVAETVDYLNGTGERTGLVNVRLFRPFSVSRFMDALPPTVRKIAVLDRTKEPGASGEPLYQDVVTAFMESRKGKEMPCIVGGRYGISSKEFTPAMVNAVFDELKKDAPGNHFTIGIRDDVSGTSLPYDKTFRVKKHAFSGLFYGLGSDGTVSANKNSIKIIGEATGNFVQGYFVYDSKKAGAQTISHLRFDEKPIRSAYLIDRADFLACHQFNFLWKYRMLDNIREGGTFLLNAPYPAKEVWDKLPEEVRTAIWNKNLDLYTIDASVVARASGLGMRTNTILQTCFFAISGILPEAAAMAAIKKAIEKTYAAKGRDVVEKNFRAVDEALKHLQKVDYAKESVRSAATSNGLRLRENTAAEAPPFVRNVLMEIMAGRGDELPVSAFPPDGVFPSATSRWEKRNIADRAPEWDEQLCIQCNKCVLICPHAAIRAKIADRNILTKAPEGFRTADPIGREFDREKETYTLQVSAADCTGCSLCVEVCPALDKKTGGRKALNMTGHHSNVSVNRECWDFFLTLPDPERTRVNIASVKGSQLLRPLFEFSGACAGCGETPYLKLISQLFGDHMIVANATGCSSIYGGNLPTTPWACNAVGKGPAWANSLFEDNAEFGLGIRLALDKKREKARNLLQSLNTGVGEELTGQILDGDETTEKNRLAQQDRVASLKHTLQRMNTAEALHLLSVADNLCRKTVWIVGGDGWAYDIGYGGLDHVLASGENVNILVMDTEVYSNTGGQTSKATPLAASARFSASGKSTPKKDLALHAIAYGNVYVAQVAMGAKDTQTVRAIAEADHYSGPSIVIAYSHCIEHGFDMGKGAEHQAKAVESGHWPLFRYNPLNDAGKRLQMDSKEPSVPLREFMQMENRFARTVLQNKDHGERLLKMAEDEAARRWERLKALSHL